MSLCDICKSIPFEDLPPFPEEEYISTLTGLEYVHTLVRNIAIPLAATATSVRHHANIESLRKAAAEGCELCLLIQGEADVLLAELESQTEYRSHGPPTFDMWLTKRPEGGQGFWVLSECSAGTMGNPTIPIAAFGFTVAEDDTLAGIFRGRPVEQNPDMQTLQRLARWDAECERDHECYHGTSPMPSHLIDLRISKSGDTVKLVKLDTKARQKYTALTYASESGIVGYWEQNVLPEDGNIIVSGLPKIFQDAILVTRTLGVQYIWIDSLCILGNAREWARDSEQAGSVYANAYLTISATGSESTSDGLLFSRSRRTSLQIPYTTSDDITGTIIVSPLPLFKEAIRSRYIEMNKEPISKGVWSFQERVLSPRIVHFASDQIYFECLGHFVSEDGLLQHLRYHTAIENLPEGAAHYRQRRGKDMSLSRWFVILWDYGQRQSSTPSEKLLALSNVARAFQHILDDEYVAGYWKKSLIESLCWHSLRCKPAGESSIPSWSWASVDGIPFVGFKNNSAHFIASVVNTQVTLLDATNPFGRVTAASIELQAPLVPLMVFEKPGPNGDMYLRTDNSDKDGFYAGFDTIDRHYANSAEALQNIKLFALILAETHKKECSTGDCNIGGTLRGLIVTPVVTSADRVKRLGFIMASSHNFANGELSNSRKTVMLV